jgi:hypothetical protein
MNKLIKYVLSSTVASLNGVHGNKGCAVVIIFEIKVYCLWRRKNSVKFLNHYPPKEGVEHFHSDRINSKSHILVILVFIMPSFVNRLLYQGMT